MNGSDPKVTSIDEETMESAPFFLKAIVVGLGIAIIAMLGLILYKIVAGPAEEEITPSSVSTAAETEQLESLTGRLWMGGPEAQDFDITVPEGATLVSTVPAGAEVFLHVKLADGTDQVLILNRVTGDISRLWVKPEGN